MEVYTINPICIRMKTYDRNNLWEMRSFNTIKNNGDWFEMIPLNAEPTKNGKYAQISQENDCPSKLSHEERIRFLEEKIERSENEKILKQNNNLICDCISLVYKKIIVIIKENHKTDLDSLGINFTSWEFLLFLLENNPILETYIKEAYKSLRFSDDEWQQIRNFKFRRNSQTHQPININNVIQIINNYPDKSNPVLIKGLTKIVEQCKSSNI